MHPFIESPRKPVALAGILSCALATPLRVSAEGTNSTGPGAPAAGPGPVTVGADFEALSNVPQVLGALVLVLALVLGLAWLARRLLRVPTRNDGAIQVVAGLPLGPRERLLLVAVGGEQVLLGLAPGRIETLHVLTNPVTPDGVARSDFAELMTGGWRRRGEAVPRNADSDEFAHDSSPDPGAR